MNDLEILKEEQRKYRGRRVDDRLSKIIVQIRLSFVLVLAVILIMSGCNSSKTQTSNDPHGKANTALIQSNKKTQIVTTIYSLDLKEYEEARIDVIPFYSRGEMKHQTEETVNAFHEGHHSWLGHAETFVETQVSNLVPSAYKKDETIKKEFIKIENQSENKASATIMLRDYYYEVTLESSESTGGIFFITNIVLYTTLEDNVVTVELDEKPEIISQLDFTISGKVNGLKSDYLLYQVEDGHGFLSEGKITVELDGAFRSNLWIKSPSNEYGVLTFYSDVNHNGIFDQEVDIEQELGSFNLSFHKSIVVTTPISSDSA